MSIRRSAAFTVGGNALQFGVQFAASVIIARLLTPDEMGVFAIGMAVYGLVFALQNTGIAQYIIAHEDLGQRAMATVLGMALLQAGLMFLLLAGLSIALPFLMQEPRLAEVMLILAAVALVSPAEHVPSGLLQRRMRFDLFFVINAVKTGVNATVSVGLAYHGLSYASLAWGSLAGTLTGGLLGILACRRDLWLRPGFADWRTYWRFGGSMLSVVVVSNVATRLGILALGWLQGTAAVGLFSRATGIIEMVQFGLLDPLGRLVLPALSAQQRKGGAMGPLYLRIVEGVTAIAWPAFAGLAVLAAPVIGLLYGDAWVPAALPLVLLCVSRVIVEMATCPVEVMIVTGRMDTLHRVVAIRSIAGLAAFVAGAAWSLPAAASGRVLEAALGTVLFLPPLRRALGIGAAQQVGAWRSSLAGTAAAVAPALAWMAWQGWPQSVPLAVLSALVLAGVLLWFGVLAAGGHVIWQQARHVLHALLARWQGNGRQ